MASERRRPRLIRNYAAAARSHALDLASSLLLFFGASVMAGHRVARTA